MVLSPCESPVLVSVDWMAFSCRLAHPFRGQGEMVMPQGWQVLQCTPTAVWADRWFVMDWEGNKVATLLMTPRSSIIDATRAVVEIANPVLYCTEYENYVDTILSVLPMEITGVQRVDLCGDFAMTRRLWSIVRALERGEDYLKGLRRGVVWWCADNGRRIPHQISWGGMDSVFHWKLYWKYKELHADGSPMPTKPYIEDLWRMANLTPQSMWRLEVSITDCNRVVKPDGTSVGCRDWWPLRGEMYRKLVMDKFVVKELHDEHNRRYDPVVTLFDFEAEGKFLRHKGSKNAIESDAERRVVCKCWKEFCDPEVRANDFLKDALRDFLARMFTMERNVNAVMRRFNLSHADLMKTMGYS